MHAPKELYCIGTGPGDPELLTLKAVRLLKNADRIAVVGRNPQKSLAYRIAVQAVPELAEKELTGLELPMIRDREILEKKRREAADVLAGKTVYGANGSVVGTMPDNGATGGTIGTKAGTVTIPAGYTTGGTVSLTDVGDLLPGNLLSGKSVLGIDGSLTLPVISQDATTKVLSIS